MSKKYLNIEITDNLTIDGDLILGTSTPAADAVIDVSSTTKGFLLPRVTTAERDLIGIGSPPVPTIGLTIYNTDTDDIEFWNGSSWQGTAGAGTTISGLTEDVISVGNATGDNVQDGTWAFTGNDLYPLTDSANIGSPGSPDRRISTIYMSSAINYETTFNFETDGNLGITYERGGADIFTFTASSVSNGTFDILSNTNQSVRLSADSSDSYITNGNFGVGLNTGIAAKLHIKGDGTTSGTTSLLLENNSGTDYFEAKDDGTVFIQSNSNSVNVLDVRSNGTTGTSTALNVRNTASGSGGNRGLSVNVANASGENNAIYVSAGDVLVGAGSIDTRLTVNTTHISDSRFYSNILDGSSLSVAIRANSQQTSGTTYGVFSDINGTNSGDNIAGYFRAINGANNYALLVDDGFVGIGTTTPTRRFQLDGNLTQDAWGLDGIHFDSNAAIFTDDSTAASGTATNAVINSFGQPILAATNSSVTTTNAATIYVAGAPTAGTNQTITNAYSLWIDDGLVQIDDALVVGNPTGGDQGTGTINAVEVYDDGSLLTDYVFDHYLDNKIKETDIKNNPELKNYKRYSLKQAWNFVKDNHHLPTMVGREEWLESRSSLGQLTNQLWETVENQFLYIKELEERIDKLEKTQTN